MLTCYISDIKLQYQALVFEQSFHSCQRSIVGSRLEFEDLTQKRVDVHIIECLYGVALLECRPVSQEDGMHRWLTVIITMASNN